MLALHLTMSRFPWIIKTNKLGEPSLNGLFVFRDLKVVVVTAIIAFAWIIFLSAVA